MESLVIEGKNYISSKRAAELMGYTQDYIGQLARAGKISAERVSGVWYVSEDEFLGHSKSRVKKGGNFIDNLSNQNKEDKDGITNKTNAQGTSKEQSKVIKDKNNIVLDGVDYISSKRAAQIMGYTQDYIGQLCRGGKIEARQVGRGWYVPKSVVYKDKEKEVQKEQIAPRKEALGDIVVFKKEKIVKSPVVKEFVNKEVVEDSKKELSRVFEEESESKKEDYYYPSFLDATYSFDGSPLIPSPKRSREPVLHQIVTKEAVKRGKDASESNVVIRRDLISVTTAPQKQVSIQEPIQGPRKVLKITKDILKSKSKSQGNELAVRSPLSLMKIASMGVAVLLLASMVTFVPSISVFSSDTGTLKTVFSPKTPQNDVLKAEAVAVTSKTSLLETIMSTFIGFFENKIEYKAK